MKTPAFLSLRGALAALTSGLLSATLLPAPTNASGCAPLPPGAVAWWPGESNAWDVLGGYDGTFSWPLNPGTNRVAFPPGVKGLAWDVSSTREVFIPDAGQLNLHAAAGFSFECWVWVGSSSPSNSPAISTRPLFSWLSPTAMNPISPVRTFDPVRFQVLHPDLGGIVLTLRPSGLQPIAFVLRSTSASLRSNVWEHVAFAYDKAAGRATLWLNGRALATTNWPALPMGPLGGLVLGGPGGYASQDNRLDEATLYNRALSDDEVRAIYLAGEAGKCPPQPECGLELGAIAGWWRGESNRLDSINLKTAASFQPVVYTNGQFGAAFAISPGRHFWIPAAPEMDVGAGPGFAVETWVRPSATGGFPIWEWNNGTGTPGVAMSYALSGGNTLDVNLRDTAGRTNLLRLTYTGLRSNQWQHLVLSYNRQSGEALLFTNGGVGLRTNLGSFVPATTGNLYLGFRPTGTNAGIPFTGALDEVTVYRRSLTAREVRCAFQFGPDGKWPPPAPCGPVDDSVVGWWRGESNAVDSVADNHGVMYPWPQGAYTAGRHGQAFACGTNAYVRIRSPVGLDVGAGPGLTLSAWIQITNSTLSGLGRASIAGWDLNSRDVSIGFDWQEHLRLTLQDTNGALRELLAPTGLVQVARWHHVAGTFERASGRTALYLDGAMVAWTNFPNFRPDTRGSVMIGRSYGGHPFLGAVDEFAIHNRALDPAEVNALARAVNGFCMEPPVIVRQPEPPVLRVNAGSTVTFSAEATGNPRLRYQWFRGIFSNNALPVKDNGTNATLTLTNVQGAAESPYWLRVTNAFGAVTRSVVRLLVNFPPVADASATPTRLLSPNNTNATVVLDGTRSRDPDQDPLAFTWWRGNDASPLATGAIAAVTLPVGEHALRLVVDDGLLTATNGFTLRVLTPAPAVRELLAQVRAAAAGKGRSLVATLTAAATALERGNPVAGRQLLAAFQKQVQAQFAANDPQAAAFLAEAQAIIDALDLGQLPGPGRSRLDGAWAEGRVRLRFTGPAAASYIVEASTNLIHWEKIGVAQPGGDGRFEFADPREGEFPARFYRIVTP